MSSKNSTSKLILETCQTILKKLESLEERMAKMEEQLSKTSTTKARSSSPKEKPKKKAKIEKSGKVVINNYNDALLVTGDTYDKRVVLKKYKAMWNKDKKGWYVKKDYYDQLKPALEECSLSFSEVDVDEYYFQEKLNNVSNGTPDDGSVDSSYNPKAKYAFLSDDED